RHGEGDAERRVQEIAPPDIALFRLISEKHTINAVQEAFAVARTGSGHTELPCVPLSQFDAPWRIRMAGEKIKGWLTLSMDLAEILVGVHGPQEASCREGVIADTTDGLDADRIGFQFLVARELRHLQLASHNG